MLRKVTVLLVWVRRGGRLQQQVATDKQMSMFLHGHVCGSHYSASKAFFIWKDDVTITEGKLNGTSVPAASLFALLVKKIPKIQ